MLSIVHEMICLTIRILRHYKHHLISVAVLKNQSVKYKIWVKIVKKLHFEAKLATLLVVLL